MNQIIQDMVDAAPTRPQLTEDEKAIVRLWVDRAKDGRRMVARIEKARREEDRCS